MTCLKGYHHRKTPAYLLLTVAAIHSLTKMTFSGMNAAKGAKILFDFENVIFSSVLSGFYPPFGNIMLFWGEKGDLKTPTTDHSPVFKPETRISVRGHLVVQLCGPADMECLLVMSNGSPGRTGCHPRGSWCRVFPKSSFSNATPE